MATYKKVAGTPGSPLQAFAQEDFTARKLSAQHSVTSLRSPATGRFIEVSKMTIDARQMVTAPGECTDAVCKPTYPAVVKIIFSAPEGTDFTELYAAAEAAVTAFKAMPKASLFFPQVDEIVVS